MELADTTAWSWSRRRANPELRAWFDDALIEGELAICDMVTLELLHSARNPSDFEGLAEELRALPRCAITEAEWGRALWVYGRLAARGGTLHRSVKHADLLIAAAAEAAGIGLVHYDADYEAIGKVTGQPMRWLAPRGSLT
jgi:predicted nucleic acid-binding protein